MVNGRVVVVVVGCDCNRGHGLRAQTVVLFFPTFVLVCPVYAYKCDHTNDERSTFFAVLPHTSIFHTVGMVWYGTTLPITAI